VAQFLGIGEGTGICSFKFADLRHNGVLSLVVGSGVSFSPEPCRFVAIIDKTGSGFEAYSSGGSGNYGMDVPGKIRDLRHDGKLELLLDQTIGVWQNRCQAQWPAIYAWTGKNYTDVSDQFKDFYRQRLKALEQKIAAIKPIPTQNGTVWHPPEKECLMAEAAQLKRFLGISPEAGLDQAIRLSTSESRTLRLFAEDLLEDIGGPRAVERLRILAKDRDGNVAFTAKYCLATLAKGPVELAPAAFQRREFTPY
jgi:hypothetical protein